MLQNVASTNSRVNHRRGKRSFYVYTRSSLMLILQNLTNNVTRLIASSITTFKGCLPSSSTMSTKQRSWKSRISYLVVCILWCTSTRPACRLCTRLPAVYSCRNLLILRGAENGARSVILQAKLSNTKGSCIRESIR